MCFIINIEEVELYKKIRKLFQTPTEILEIVKALVFPNQTVYPIFDGFTRTTVMTYVVFNFSVIFKHRKYHEILFKK